VVEFKVADALTEAFPANHFDIIYSRDTILHIVSKDALFTRLFDSTKPGGHLLVTDYCAGPRSMWDANFTSYVKSRGYDLLTVEAYASILKKAGWQVELAEDTSSWFGEILTEEVRRLEEKRKDVVKAGLLSEEEVNSLKEGWEAKIVRNKAGMQRYLFFLDI